MTRDDSIDPREPAVLIGAAAIVIGLGAAAWGAWTSDAAFVGFRYARNLVEGRGFVFNPGERVEGFTNLLWTLWISVGLALHVEAEPWAIAWGLVSYALVLSLLLGFHLELRRRLPVGRATLPVACLVCAFHPDFQEFATGGLETAAFTLSAFAGYLLLVAGTVRGQARPFLTAALFTLASLLRADGLVLGAIAFVVLVVRSPRPIRDGVRFASVIGVSWAALTAFRVAYFGDYLPNPYYARSAYTSWYSQGLAYLGVYAQRYFALLLVPVAVGMAERRRRQVTPDDDWLATHARVSAVFAVAYAAYVARTGGDYMYARLLVPITPYLAVLAEVALYRVSLRRPVVALELTTLVVATPLFLPRPVTGTDAIRGILDERATRDEARAAEAAGRTEVLAALFRGLPVRVAFTGRGARLAYEASPEVAIESDAADTERSLARRPLAARGPVGHEKRADPLYLIRDRKAHILLPADGPPLERELELGGYIPVVPIELGPVQGRLLRWDPATLAELGRRGARFPDFPGRLDAYIASIDALPRERVESDYRKFRLFYFEHVPDPGREAPFKRRLGLD